MGVSPAPGYVCTSLARSALISSLKLISRAKGWKGGLNVVPSPLVGGIRPVLGESWIPTCRGCANACLSGFQPSLDSPRGKSFALNARPLGSCQPLPPTFPSALQTTHPPLWFHPPLDGWVAGSHPPDWNFLEVIASPNPARDPTFLDTGSSTAFTPILMVPSLFLISYSITWSSPLRSEVLVQQKFTIP